MRNHNKFWILRMLFMAVLVVLCGVTLVVFIRALTCGQGSEEVEKCEPMEADFIDNPEIISRFQEAIRYQTISRKIGDYNEEEMGKFISFIEEAFPLVHSSPLVRVERVANYSLLYTISGSNPDLKPAMLCAHLDVVPIAHLDEWDVPPFDGVIKDGFVYGRGTIDDKQSLMGILESVEELLKNNYQPKRTIILAFGHDEEVTGYEGARAIGQLLQSRNIQAEFILDEGLPIVSDVLVGIRYPIAMIGVTEKGYVSLRINTSFTGGHSSMPTMESSITILNKAVSKLHANSHPSMFGLGPEKGMLESVAPKMDPPFRVIMSNLWLFSPLVSWIMSRKPSSNGLVRTTTAVTEFHAGVKSNVLPPTAWATVNHRIHPAQTTQEVIDYDKYLINDDRVTIQKSGSDGGMEPAPMSPSGAKDFGYQTIKTSIHQIFPDAVVAPATMIANTDTRHYWKLSKNIYRFCPTLMGPEDLPRYHGVNERISVDNYKKTVHFYYHVLRNADRTEVLPGHSHGNEL